MLFVINVIFDEFQNNTIIEINYNIFLYFNFVDSIKIYNNEIIIENCFIIEIEIINFIIKMLNDKNKIEFLSFRKRINNDLNKTYNNKF